MGGRLIITEKNYNVGFPLFQKPEMSVNLGGKTWNERIEPGETYEQAVKRLRNKFGEKMVAGIPYYPRSAREIIEIFEELGYRCEARTVWRAKKSEPDWFGVRLPRNIFVFSKK